MTGYILLGFIFGILIGYVVFYFRYKQRDVVNELRSNLKEANKEINSLNEDLEEYLQQNTLLKEKVSELLDKNDDLGDVVSELSKYYVHIKKAAEKTSELTKFLQNPNPDIEEKINYFAKQKKHTEDDEKKFF
ncbi:YhcB family protein [Candidatus Gracilibacteria bacterium]|nr:YhcB family protein [Candidatus Gracilibacteria bacterium]